jgi:hypothetical protein
MKQQLPTSPDFDAFSAKAGQSAAQRTRVLALVGNLVFSWSNNESMFIYYLMLLLDTDFNSAAITFVSLNTTRARLDLIRRLAKARCKDPAALRRLERLIERFNDCTKVRNDFNHCIYQLDQTGRITHTNVLRLIEDKKGIRFAELQAFDEERFRQVGNTIRKLAALNRDLWSFLPEFKVALAGAVVPALPKAAGEGAA